MSRFGHSSRVFAALALCGVLGACTDTTGVEIPRPDEEIVPSTTRVLDAAARTALESVGPDGTLRFSTGTPALTHLAPGDVIVSQPTPAAPHGLLRTVRSTRSAGGAVVIETDEALLTDAVHQGSLAFTLDLSAEDVETSDSLFAGVWLERNAGELTYRFDTDLGTDGRVRVTGSATIKPIMDVDLRITCARKWKGICREFPALDFMTRVGVQEHAELTVSGNAAGTFDREVKIGEHQFKPITFSLAGVPVVFVPRLSVYLRADGSLTAKLDHSIRQNVTLAAGFRYNSKTGFTDISERAQQFVRQGPTFQGRVEVRTAVGVRFELLLYGLLGPYGGLQIGTQLVASMDGLPPDASHLWRLEACVWTFVGMRPSAVLKRSYDKEIYRACTPLAEGVNLPPVVTIAQPHAHSDVYRGIAFTLVGDVRDPENGTVTCRWTSSNAADPLPVSGCQNPVTFSTTGTRTLTLTGTDPAGKSASAQVSVDVREPPAVLATVAAPHEGQTIFPGDAITLAGGAAGGAVPYTFHWRVAWPTDAAGNGGTVHEIGPGASRNWRPSDTLAFPSCEVSGYAVLILEATDANGVRGSGRSRVSIQRVC